MTRPTPGGEECVLIVAPTGSDAGNIRAVLAAESIASAVAANLSALTPETERGCGAVVLTEEALDHPGRGDLAAALDRQPAWSDLPLVLIVSGGERTSAMAPSVCRLRARWNLVLVERPLRKDTLVSTVHSALRARRRQHQVRQLLRERDEILASLEQRVVERTAELLEVNSELETFSYSVSHDLRAPLRAIESFAQILHDDHQGEFSADAQSHLDRIRRNVRRMDRLMQDVLAFSRIARSDITIARLDLDELLDDVVGECADLAALPDPITIQRPLGVVLAHRPALAQCFSNLLQNAVKFSKPGRWPRIEVFAEARGACLRVHVRDNGVGIESAYHSRIFGLFERASPKTIPGTGVGLAIVKKAVERMGGSVGVQSEPGCGSTFWLELPAACAATELNEPVALPDGGR
ncbi:MAG TPA: HAMP domain-containing sensor histidine kinase [Opitutaceae bacterium]|nr:HAMP domain-containing sensor histidine kinase [Opitutaceae bacterium]